MELHVHCRCIQSRLNRIQMSISTEDQDYYLLEGIPLMLRLQTSLSVLHDFVFQFCMFIA